jgi:hypothetical protein
MGNVIFRVHYNLQAQLSEENPRRDPIAPCSTRICSSHGRSESLTPVRTGTVERSEQILGRLSVIRRGRFQCDNPVRIRGYSIPARQYVLWSVRPVELFGIVLRYSAYIPNQASEDREDLVQLLDLRPPGNRYLDPDGICCNAGFTDEERASFSQTLQECALLDTFRWLHPSVRAYSYIGYRHVQNYFQNRGWRLDYFCCSASAAAHIVDSYIRFDIEIYGAAFQQTQVKREEVRRLSDHCPVVLLFRTV